MYLYEPRHIIIMCDNVLKLLYIKKRTKINKLVSDNEILIVF